MTRIDLLHELAITLFTPPIPFDWNAGDFSLSTITRLGEKEHTEGFFIGDRLLFFAAGGENHGQVGLGDVLPLTFVK